MGRFLDAIERVGNRLPDPLLLFVLFSALVVFFSALASSWGLEVGHPASGERVKVVNLLSATGLRRMLTEAVENFVRFPPLGTVLVAVLGIGVAERSGFIGAALQLLVSRVPRSALTAALVFAGVMSSMAADAGFVVLIPLGAALFLGLGRHPIAGLAATFAGVSGGFSANLLLTALDPLLAGLTQPAAQLIQPDYQVLPTANYYFMVASVGLIVAVATLVTERLVEPRLGEYKIEECQVEVQELGAPDAIQLKGLWLAFLSLAACLGICAWLVLPPGAILRSPEGDLKPFYQSLITLMMLLFLVPGVVYGWVTGSLKNDRDLARMSAETMNTMGSYIVLAFAAAQFVAYFSWSNLGLVVAVKGAEFLKGVGFSGIPLLLSFVFFCGMINLLIGSASAKWAIMAPVFVPMFMLLGYSPELVQACFRVGDSVTNLITPLLPYYPLLIAYAHRYQRHLGLGTLIACMLPYSMGLGLAWAGLLTAWVSLGLPLGPGISLYYP